MTNKKRTIKELKEVLDSLDITNKYRLNLIRAIEYLQDEPMSESNEQLAETYLSVFDKKFPILPTLKGKQLADYKNFLNKCQQIFGLKEWGIHSTQAKLFEKLSLLWAAWGVEHLQEVGRQDKKEQDIPVSEDLEELPKVWDMETLDEYAYQVAYDLSNDWMKETATWDDVETAVKFGAKWKASHLWKPADGDDLPEIDREVIALLDDGKVVFAHRPSEYWDGKNIATGKVTRYYPKTYDKGGWNIPDVKFWLDVELPKETEL